MFVGRCAELLKPVEIPQVQFLDIYCGTDRGRVNSTDHEGLLGCRFFGAPVSGTGAGGAGVAGSLLPR